MGTASGDAIAPASSLQTRTSEGFSIRLRLLVLIVKMVVMHLNKTNVIDPFVGVGSIRFGLDRSRVREQLSEYSFKEFKRNQYSINTTDYYQRLNMFVEYDVNDCCEAIEFSNEALVLVFDMDIFKHKYSEAFFRLSKLSKKYSEDDFGCIFYDLGLGLYKEPESDLLETCIAFNRNYWS